MHFVWYLRLITLMSVAWNHTSYAIECYLLWEFYCSMISNMLVSLHYTLMNNSLQKITSMHSISEKSLIHVIKIADDHEIGLDRMSYTF